MQAPIFEEIAFRALPGVMGRSGSLMPIRGITSTYLFGKAHQYKLATRDKTDREKLVELFQGRKPSDKKIKIMKDETDVPVHAYALGAYFWMAARRNGIAHSILAHSLHNAIVYGGVEVENAFSKSTETDNIAD